MRSAPVTGQLNAFQAVGQGDMFGIARGCRRVKFACNEPPTSVNVAIGFASMPRAFQWTAIQGSADLTRSARSGFAS